MEEKRILIVGTQPYNKMVQSRAFESYFSSFKHENLFQIFSDSRIPCKGQCHKLFQITDKRLFKRRFDRKIQTGVLFLENDLKDEWTTFEANNKFKPKRKGVLFRWARKFLWNKRYWDTSLLEQEVTSFNPDYVFIAFSEDFFIFDIALHFAHKFNVPIILSIADDYIFKSSPKTIYRRKYLNMINSLMKEDVYGIFESEAIKDKYCAHFGIKGSVIYIGSSNIPKQVTKLSKKNDFYYFGNLEFGRLNTLIELAQYLSKNNIGNQLMVYSADYSKINKSFLPSNLHLLDQVPYNQISQLMENAGALLIVEGFSKKNIEATRYSLSTKVGDSLCSGIPVLAFGPLEAGAINFLKRHNCCFCATNINELEKMITSFFASKADDEILKNQYQTACNCFVSKEQSDAFYYIFNR